MQGYWLEGGSIVFYFQPFYRWIVGLIHVVFGDSSAGEWYWDGTCLLAGALLSFRITRRFAGFRWGLIAAAATLAVFVLGTAQYLIGQGLSEISSAGLLSMAALSVIDSRHRRVAAAIAAGLLATIGFYTRLNNLIMAAGVALFALPLDVPVRALIHPAVWWRRVAWRTVVIVAVHHRPGPAGAGMAELALQRRVRHVLRHAALRRGHLAARSAGRRVAPPADPQRDAGADGERSAAVRSVRAADSRRRRRSPS